MQQYKIGSADNDGLMQERRNSIDKKMSHFVVTC